MSDGGTYYCRNCRGEFEDWEAFQSHSCTRQAVPLPNSWHCRKGCGDICDKEAKRDWHERNECTGNYIRHPLTGKLCLPSCEKCGTGMHDQAEHERKFHMPWECYMKCGATGQGKDSLDHHVQSRHGVTLGYCCTICGISYESETEFGHISRCTGRPRSRSGTME